MKKLSSRDIAEPVRWLSEMMTVVRFDDRISETDRAEKLKNMKILLKSSISWAEYLQDKERTEING